jgi:ribosomal protein L44E
MRGPPQASRQWAGPALTKPQHACDIALSMIRELAALPAGDADVLAGSVRPTFSYASDEVSKLSQRVIRLVEQLSGQRRIVRLYESYRGQQRPPEAFWQDAISTLRLDLRSTATRCCRFRRQGRRSSSPTTPSASSTV